MEYCIAVWKYKGREEEGTIPSNWIKNGKVYYPQSINNRKYFAQRTTPKENWLELPLVKVKCRGDLETCLELENAGYTTEESRDVSTSSKYKSVSSTISKDNRLPKWPMQISTPPTSPAAPASRGCLLTPRKESRGNSKSWTHLTSTGYRSRSSSPRSPVVRNKVSTNVRARSSSPRSPVVRKKAPTSDGPEILETELSAVFGDFQVGDADNAATTKKSPYPMSNEKFQRKTITLLTEIKLLLQDRKNNTINDDSAGVSTTNPKMDITLLTTLEEFHDQEKNLQSSENYSSLVGKLRRIGGTNYKDHAKSLLRLLMSNRLQSKFSMVGAKKNKSGKECFQNTKLYEAITEAVMAKFKKVTKNELRKYLMDQLKYAPDRIDGGGRRSLTEIDSEAAVHNRESTPIEEEHL